MGVYTPLFLLWLSIVAAQTSSNNGLWTTSTTSYWEATSTQVTTYYTQNNVIVTITTWVPCTTTYYPPPPLTETEVVTSTYCNECEQSTPTYCQECHQPTSAVVTDLQPISTTTYTENGETYVVVIMPSTTQPGATNVVTTIVGNVAATASQALELTSAAEPIQDKNSLLGFVFGLVVLSIWL